MKTDSPTYYFAAEGRPAMEECIQRSADWCLANNIATMVIFTGTGAGPHYAAKELLIQEQFKNLRVVAVTPPVGRPYRSDLNDPNSPLIQSGINPAMRDELMSLGIGIVSAHLPFKEMYDGKERTSEWTRVAEAFGILGGGFALCVQAVLVACDAGFVQHGERVVALTADTAIEASACRTESFLSPLEGLLVGHIICRPARYTISKRIHEAIKTTESQASAIETSGTAIELPQQVPAQLPPSPPAAPKKPRPRKSGVARPRGSES